MKKIAFPIWILAILAFAVTSCVKKDNFDPQVQREIEDNLIAEYVQEKFPEATKHNDSGIWWAILVDAEESDDDYEYKIIENYLESPVIKVNYSGKLLSGVQFDSGNDVTFNLGNLIVVAWHAMFLPSKIGETDVFGITPKGLRKGMKVRFVTPSQWAYGRYGQGNIPSNAPLDFTIEVLDINPPTQSDNQ